MINKYICGFCQDRKHSFISSRRGLRSHLKKEHFILKAISNSGGVDSNTKRNRQSWWVIEAFE